MLDDVTRYPRYRFPPAIISHAVRLYYRFTLSFRDVEDSSRNAASPSHTKPSGTGVRPSASPTRDGSAVTEGRRRYVASGRVVRDDQRPASIFMARGGSRR